jgi:type II secretory pathway pseudopilin PulG
MTLVELLVVIVVMVAVLAGVIPMISPNNDARRIREATRQLNSMIAQAQAQAARDGRAVGVAFREFGNTPPRSGMAYEAYFIAEPPPYAGFSENSQVRLLLKKNQTTGIVEVQEAQFVLAGQLNTNNSTPDEYYMPDAVPADSIRFGDLLVVSGFTFVILDQDRDGDTNPDTDSPAPSGSTVFELGDFYTTPRSTLRCLYIGHVLDGDGNVRYPSPAMVLTAVMTSPKVSDAPVPENGWTTPRPYRIVRQPRNTSDQPVQFPEGIGIDLDASGATGKSGGASPVPGSFDGGGSDLVAMMFGPTGSMESFYYNGVKHEDVSDVFLLMGRGENGNNGSQDPNDYDFSSPVDDDELAERRQRLNWLNADSMWLTVNARSGRVSTEDINTFDPRHQQVVGNPPGTPREQRGRQIAVSRNYANDGLGTGGR